MFHHPGDDAHVDLGHALERPVEPAVEPVRPLVAAGPQPRRALDRLQRERVDRADDRGGGDDERELAEDLPGDAGQEGGGHEDRDQRQGDAHHRAGELLHGLDGRFLGRHPLLDVVGAVLHDDDGVVHHDADGQDQGEQGHQVHGEPESGHRDEGADDGDRHGGGGNQHAAEVLQEEEDDHEDQHARDEQGVVDGGDGFPDEERGVVPDRVLHALGELLAHLGHGLVDAIGDLDGVGARQGEHHDLSRFVTGESREVAEALLAQFDPGDIAESHELGGGAAGRLDRDRVELAGVGEPAEGVDRELEGLVLRDRRAADLPGHHLDVLPPDGSQHVLGREPEGLQALRVQPDPHAVGAGSEYPDLADALDPGQGVLQVDDRVVGEEGLVVAIVLGIEARHQQDVGGDLPDRDPLGGDASRELGQGAVGEVLDQGQGGVEVRPDVEGDGHGVRAVAGAGRRHVDGILDAIDRLLQRHPDRGRDHLRARARVSRAHLDGRRHDLGILSDGQPVEEYAPDDDGDEGDDVGEDRVLDEELGDHGAAFFAGGEGRASGPGSPSRSGVTGRPGAAFSTPLTTTHSPPVRPVAMTRRLSTAAPVVTGRRSTTFLSFTTSR